MAPKPNRGNRSDFRKDQGCGERSWARSSGPAALTWEKVTWSWSHTVTWFSWMGTKKTTLMGSFLPPRLLNCVGWGGADIRVLAFLPPPATRIMLPTPDSPVLNQASQTRASCLLMLSERQESTGVRHPFQSQTGWWKHWLFHSVGVRLWACSFSLSEPQFLRL